MKILFLGDIVGKKGREVVRDFLPVLKDKYHPDFTIVNGENAAHGKGITIKIYNELLGYGANCITMGNHTFSKKEILDHLDEMNDLVCPYNHILREGYGYRIYNVCGIKLCVINLLGTIMQEEYTTSPYIAMDEILDLTKKDKIDLYFVDFHAETTAEKRVFVEYYKNKVSTVVCTHTHIQTADEQIINGCGFITDVGMCGPYNSIIGRDIDECIRRMVYGESTKYTISESDPVLSGVYLEYNIDNRCSLIERIQIKPKSSQNF